MKSRGRLSLILGLLFIGAALFLTVYNLDESMRAGQASEEVAAILGEQIRAEQEAADQNVTEPGVLVVPDYILNPYMDMPTKSLRGFDYIGVMCIPELDMELPVISSWSYDGLSLAPCRYVGSAYLDNMVIVAHNYISHFRKLVDLQEGALATFTDVKGHVFTYEMVCREILSSTDVEAMTTGDWDMTLFTCTIGGVSRVTIRFVRVEDSL